MLAVNRVHDIFQTQTKASQTDNSSQLFYATSALNVI